MTRVFATLGRFALWAAAGFALVSCSIQRMAIDRLGDALASGASVYARDDDPELVKDALPFALKTIEGLIEKSPRHEGLLVAGASGFTQYSYAFVQSEADFVEDDDLSRAKALRARAVRLYRRALGYGIRALELHRPGVIEQLRRDPGATLAVFEKSDVPALYWTAAAWASAISIAKDNPELTADLWLTEALMARARELDSGFGDGAIHDFFIAYDGGRPAAAGGSIERARESFNEALRWSKGRRAAPFVSFAETVAIGQQNRVEFEKLLQQALAVDVEAAPDQRLANVISQKRARWLLGREDLLFLE